MVPEVVVVLVVAVGASAAIEVSDTIKLSCDDD